VWDNQPGVAMSNDDTLSRISGLDLLAVLRGPSPELALKMVEGLIASGVNGVEITFSTPDLWVVSDSSLKEIM
jgi:2-keto-3-deoxy-6-phosphogluconate aldolase